MLQLVYREGFDLDCCHETIEFLGKRWMVRIIHVLLDGPKRYHEIYSAIPGISDKLLSQRLQELIDAHLVEKDYIEASLKKVSYTLTNKGYAFQKVICAFNDWQKL